MAAQKVSTLRELYKLALGDEEIFKLVIITPELLVSGLSTRIDISSLTEGEVGYLSYSKNMDRRDIAKILVLMNILSKSKWRFQRSFDFFLFYKV